MITKRFFSLLILPLCLACRNNGDSSNNVLTIANQGLLNAATSAKSSTETVLLAIKERTVDPIMSQKAILVEPKALAIDRQANNLIDRIEKIKDQLAKDLDGRTVSNNILRQTANLPGWLLCLRDSILQNNLYFKNEPGTMPVLFSEKLDQQIMNGESINTLLFESISPLEATTLLSRFQLNIRQLSLRNAVILFESTTRLILDCRFPVPLIGQSHQVLKPDGQLTIEVAMAEVRYNGLQKVKMNGKEIQPNETGTCKAIIKVPSIAGKYSVPILVSYTDQDGKEQTIKKDITYEVATCETGSAEKKDVH